MKAPLFLLATLSTFGAASAAEPPRVRVVSWNVEFGARGSAEEIAEALKPLRPDIVAFCEVPGGDWTARAGKILNLPHSYVGKISSANHKDKYKSILSRTPLTATSEVELKGDAGWNPASFVRAETLVADKPLAVYSLHIAGLGSRKQAAQQEAAQRRPHARQLLDYLNTREPRDRVLVMGDFNDRMDQPVMSMLEAGGWRPTWRDLKMDLKEQFSFNAATGKPGGVIDHVLLRVGGWMRVTEGGILELPRALADHKAVWAEVELEPTKKNGYPWFKFPDVDDLPAHAQLPDPRTSAVPDTTTPVEGGAWPTAHTKALFEHYVYGQAPPAPGITSRVTKEALVLGGKAKLKEIEIKLGGLPDDAPRIRLALIVPTAAKGPTAGKSRVPVFLTLNGWGNHAVVPDEAVTHNEKAWVDKPRTRGSEADFWCVADVIDCGYAFATFHQSDIAPDTPDAGRQSIITWYPNLATPQTRWGVLAAWAWGMSRAVDYLVTDDDIDARRIAVLGHSRRGKAALLAGAFDERIWLTVPHQSGTGGCALSRNNDQETIEKINRSFPHWFNDVFPRFAGREDRLPVDQHLLVALVAPRLLLETEGTQDKWANFDSALRALREADKVYKFHGAAGMIGDGVISGDTKFTVENCGDLAQYRLDEKHTLNAHFWRAILDFADVQQARAARKPK